MYKHKYNKYVSKLSQQQQGGSPHLEVTFDTIKGFVVENDVQQTMNNMWNTCGNFFTITYEKFAIPVELHKITFISNGLNFFELRYDLKKRTFSRSPFAIWFYDPKTLELNNNTLIQYIHRTDEINGSTMMNFVLELQRMLNVNKTFLHDGAKITCVANKIDYDLSFFKLLEKGKTFYMKFGFDVDPLKHYSNEIPFNSNSKEDWHKLMKDYLGEIKKITVSSIIKQFSELKEMIGKVGDNHKDFYVKYVLSSILEPYDYYYEKDPEKKMSELTKAADSILGWYEKSENSEVISNVDDNLCQLLILLFNDKNKCADYNIFSANILQSNIIEVEYKETVLKFDYIVWFKNVLSLKSYTHYAYTFKK